MRRAVSILLLALFGFTLTAPAWSFGVETKLPPCCRRDGKHGCGMKAKSAPEGPTWRANLVCAAYGQGSVTPAASKAFLTTARVSTLAAFVSHPTAAEQTEARARISLHCSRQKRGPPSFHS